MVVSIIDNESNSRDQKNSSSNEDDRNYVAFTSIVKSDSDNDSEKVEHVGRSEATYREFEDGEDIRKAYE